MTELNLPLAYYVFFAFIFGLIIGSFLNVVIHRIPRDESIVFPGSHCPLCQKPIGALDNIPLLSYLLLRGRCRHCRQRISLIYPLVELLTALLFVSLVLKDSPTWETLIEMIFGAAMLALIFIDARHHLLPNAITYPTFVYALATAAVIGGWGEQTVNTVGISLIIPALDAGFVAWRAALFGGLLVALAAPGFWLLDYLDLILFNKYFEWEEMNEATSEDEAVKPHEDEVGRWQDRIIYLTMILGLLLAGAWAAAVIKFSASAGPTYENAYSGILQASAGALIGGGLIWWLRTLYFYIRGIEGMGLGDVKMMSIIGAFLGWQSMFSVLLLGSILGSIVGAIMAFRSKRGLKTPLPFGVCLGVASLIVLLISN